MVSYYSYNLIVVGVKEVILIVVMRNIYFCIPRVSLALSMMPPPVPPLVAWSLLPERVSPAFWVPLLLSSGWTELFRVRCLLTQ